MEECILFDESLFGDEPVFKKVPVSDLNFWVSRLVSFPSYRPMFLAEIVELCKEYCLDPVFRKSFLENAWKRKSVLVHRLYQKGFLEFSEIKPFFNIESDYKMCYYFQNELDDFENMIKGKKIPDDYIKHYFSDLSQINELIMFGYPRNSVEYCLKYDDVDTLINLLSNPGFEKCTKAKLSPFEWSICPSSMSFLPVAGHYGSIKCFKHLLFNGHMIDADVCQSVTFGGSTELFHLCFNSSNDMSVFCSYAAKASRFSILRYFLENNISLNSKNDRILIPSFH